MIELENKTKVKLTEQQKNRLKVLRPALRNSAKTRDNNNAKKIISEIQGLLRPTGHETMLMQFKNWYFEAEMEAGNIEHAKTGFIGIRKKTSQHTRVHLEATALLAVCYLRNGEINVAEPLMATVLKHETNIKSENRRREFRLNVIQRFEEEGALASFRNKFKENLNIKEIEISAGQLLQTYNEDDLFTLIGKYSPPETKAIILRIENFSRNQLPKYDLKFLPDPAHRIKDEQVGRTVFSSFKRTLWRSLCDPSSEVYKLWCEKGMGVLFSKSYLTGIVVSSVLDIGLGYAAIAAPIVALIFRFGLDVYCDRYNPNGIMIE